MLPSTVWLIATGVNRLFETLPESGIEDIATGYLRRFQGVARIRRFNGIERLLARISACVEVLTSSLWRCSCLRLARRVGIRGIAQHMILMVLQQVVSPVKPEGAAYHRRW